MNSETRQNQPSGMYRPKLAFYHPNGKGTGGAMKMELLPAHDDTEGCIMLKVANQTGVGDRRGATPTFARFDWERAICVKLGFSDLCKFLQVLRGECEAIDEGRGLYHRSAKGTTRIVLRHVIEQFQGYALEVYRSAANGEETHGRLLLNAAEAMGLCESISGAMYLVSFGIPMVIRREALENGRLRHVSAA